MKQLLIIVSFLAVFTQKSFAAIDRNSFKEVDSFVTRMGAMEGYGMRDIIDSLKRARFSELGIVRGIYYWIGNHIEYDTWAFHHKGQSNNTASYVLNNRKAISEGYVNLFQAMCNMARIRCVTIRGYSKWNYENVGRLDPRNRHSWNAVQIDNTWYVVDPTWAAGYTDIRVREFTRSFTDAWFLANRELFAMSHFPDDVKWQLQDDPLNKSLFNSGPVVFEGALIYGIFPGERLRGTIKGRETECKALAFDISNPQLIKKVEVSDGEKLQPAEYHIFNDKLYVEVPFMEDGSYPVAVHVNNARTFSFKAVASKKKR